MYFIDKDLIVSSIKQNNIDFFNNINKRVFNAVMTSILDAGMRPFLVCLTNFVNGLPANMYSDKACILNIDPEAVGKYIEGDDSFEVEMRFGGKPHSILIKYAGVIMMRAMDGSSVFHTYKLNTHEFGNQEFFAHVQELLMTEDNTANKETKFVDTAPSESEPSSVPVASAKPNVSYLRLVK